jgi:hypothetical protein
MGKKSAPSPPDLSGTAAASEKNAALAAQLSREQLDWSKEMWAEQKAYLDDVMDLQLPMMEEQWKISQEDRQRYEDFYQPLEEEYLARAKEWDTPERRNAEAAKAQTEVASQFDAQRQQALQRLESYGVDPSQTRNAALDVGVRIDQAKAMAQGASNARNQTEREGMGMLGESINVGRGLPSQGLQYAGQSLAAGNAAAGNAAGWQGAANAMGSPQGWMNTSNQGYAQSANIQNAGYQNQLGAWEAKQKNSPLNLVGGLAGAYIGGGMPGMFKDGGEVRALPRYANGGEVDGPGGPRDDAIPARLSDGEYIVPADVVSRKGTEFFDKLVTKTQEDVAAREQNAQATQHALALPPPGALS